MKFQILRPSTSKSYGSVSEALEEHGFKKIGQVVFAKRLQHERHDVYEKDGQVFYVVSAEHFNTTIYSINLKNVEALKDYHLIIN